MAEQPRDDAVTRSPVAQLVESASSIPKWWAISWTTVIRTSRTSSSSSAHISSNGRRKIVIRSGRPEWSAPRSVSETPSYTPSRSGSPAGGLVLDEDDDVVHQVGDLVRDLVQSLLDQRLEGLAVQLHAGSVATDDERPGPCGPGRLCRVRATPTGLEPAASAVTGRRANQLRYGAWWRSGVTTGADGTLTHPIGRLPIHSQPVTAVSHCDHGEEPAAAVDELQPWSTRALRRVGRGVQQPGWLSPAGCRDGGSAGSSSSSWWSRSSRSSCSRPSCHGTRANPRATRRAEWSEGSRTCSSPNAASRSTGTWCATCTGTAHG